MLPHGKAGCRIEGAGERVRCLPLLRIRHAERELADRIGCHNGHVGQFRQHAALARSPILEKLREHDLVSAARAAHGQSDRRCGFALAIAAVQVNESCHAFPSIIR